MADISKIVLPDGSEYNIKDTTARGLVVANPTLAGTERDLTGLQVNGTKYKIPSGGGSSISPYASNPAMDGTASPGSSNDYARGDHVHPSDTSKLGTSGDGSNVTVAFTAASSRTNISTGEKLSALMGKIAKWFADLGAAAFRGVDSVPTANSTNLVESGGVKSALNNAKALSFTVTLTANGWSNNAQTVSNAYFVASGYAYTVCPSASNYTAYADAQIYADDVVANGSMTFHCASVPTGNLTVNVLRVEVQ